MRNPFHVAVIGGGFSGVALAAELVRHGRESLRVTLLEAGERLGRGVAYGTPRASHLLNTRAEQMSLFADDAEHCVRWHRSRGQAMHATEFLARRDYGDYVERAFTEVCSAGSPVSVAIHLRTQVTDLARTAAGFELQTGDGWSLRADAVIVATGHPSPADPLADWLPGESRRYVRNPWQHERFAAIGANDRVLVLGTGLTAVDVVLALEEQGHVAPVRALSRRGLLPQTHTHRQVLPRDLCDALFTGIALGNLQHVLRTVRRVADAAVERGLQWQAVFDALRPATARIWDGMCASNRRQFVRWLRPFWDAHRHRLAPGPAARIAALRVSGRFAVCAGRVQRAREDGDAIVVEYTPRGTRTVVHEAYDWIINCTGPSFARHNSRPFERRLLERGLLLPDPLALGYVTGPTGAVIGARGPVPGLYVLGPACRPNLWEHTAVPELRAQAAALATELIATAALPQRVERRN